MEIGQIIKYVMLGLDISVVGLILINFVIGLIRGFSKSLNRLIIVAVCAIGFLMFLNPIAKTVASKEVPVPYVETQAQNLGTTLPSELTDDETISIQKAVSSIIVAKVYGENAPETNELKNLVEDYSFIVVKILVYVVGLVGLILAHIILDIVFAIIRGILHIKLKRKKRLLGGLVYIVRYAVFFVVVMLPIFGIVSLGQSFAKEVVNYKEELNLNADDEKILQSYIDGVDGCYTRNLVLKPLTSVFASEYKDETTFDAVYVGNAISTTTSKGVEFKFFDEYAQVKKIIPAVFKAMGMVKDETATEKVIDLSKFTNEDIEGLVSAIGNSKLIPSALPAAIEYAIYNASQQEEKDAATIKALQQLQNVDWEKELVSFSKVIEVIKDHKDVVINLSDTKALLKNKEAIELAKDIVIKILEIDTVKEVALPVLLDYLAVKLENNELGIDVEEVKQLDLAKEAIPLLNAVAKLAEAYAELNIETLDKTAIATIINKEDIVTIVKDVMTEFFSSEGIKEIILPVVCQKLEEIVPDKESIGVDLQFVTAIFTEENIIDLFTKEENIQITVNVLKAVNDLGLLGDGATLDLTDTTQLDKLIDVAKDVLNYTVLGNNETKGQIFTSVMEMAGINTALEEFGLTLDFTKVTDWNEEIDTLSQVFKKVLSMSDTLGGFDFAKLFSVEGSGMTEAELQETRETICDIIESLTKSQIFSDSILPLINNLTSKVSPDYAVTITDADRTEIEKEGGTGWHTEIMTILNIVDNAKDLLSITDYSLLPAATIRDIMKEASKGVIATKVFGTVLNKVLNGKIETDFTNRDNMSNCADLVYNLLNIASMANMDLTDPENIQALISNISDLANNEEVLDILTDVASELLGDELTSQLDAETIQEAAEVISDVMDVYTNLTEEQRENFSEEDLPDEVKDKIAEAGGENNELASMIFSYLFN